MKLLSNNRALVRLAITICLVFGVFLTLVSRWEGVSAQQSTNTPEPTETTFKISIQGTACSPNLSQLRMQLQYRAINATQAVKGALCGRTVYITEEKTGKQYLGLVPCNRSGVFILKQRPRELLNYYQFVNAKTGKGKTIISKEFGELSTYITKFETYHPLDQCSSCGALAGSAPISPPVFVFPTFPPVSGSQNAVSLSEATSTPTADISSPLIPTAEFSPVPARTATATPSPVLTPASTPTLTVVPIQASGSNSGLERTIKPPTAQLLKGVLAYSLYALLLIPLIIAAIIWKRLRIS